MNDEPFLNQPAIDWLAEHGYTHPVEPLRDHDKCCITALDALLEMYGLEAHVAVLRAFAIVTLQLPPPRRRLAYGLLRRTFGDSQLCATLWAAALGDEFSDLTHTLDPSDYIL